jgi:hypothetical protein
VVLLAFSASVLCQSGAWDNIPDAITSVGMSQVKIMNTNSSKYLIATTTGKALVMTLNDQTSKFATFYVQKTNLNG